MIYLFAGEDVKKKISAYEKFLKSELSGLETFFINRNDFDQVQIESLYAGGALFFSKCVVILNDILAHEETKDFILDKLEFLGDSPNVFIFLEGKLNKLLVDAFKKARAELNIFDLDKNSREGKEKFNNFLLANAFGVGDKLNLWIYYRQAVSKGVGLEELVGVLFWKAKDMILKRNFGKLSETELKNFTSYLAYLLPNARKRGHDAEAVFEGFLLKIF